MGPSEILALEKDLSLASSLVYFNPGKSHRYLLDGGCVGSELQKGYLLCCLGLKHEYSVFGAYSLVATAVRLFSINSKNVYTRRSR
jgi:hypothetical protein